MPLARGLPPSWEEAQTRTTCTGDGNITLDSCGSIFRWISSNGGIVNWCYYDAATSALQGAQLGTDVPVYCASPGDGGAFSVIIGSVPAGCASGDGGAVFSSRSCQPSDGGVGEAGD